ncbi:uncharacterized protein LOC130901879 [Diorhabda carinulata]|uniref:uncharacterized protein LOC130901879 n=1 Tax=Diorhabda carinulata TaxID=1163345 RepID=UPI0025A08FE4|nr:uncharacterized protein LOC130901879 [Diorhabda carinulata]
MLNLRRMFLIFSTFLLAQCITRSNTYIKNTNVEDLEMSASGYSYQTKSGAPFDYNSFSSKSHDSPHEYDTIGRYYNQPVPLNSLPLSPNFLSNINSEDVDSYGEIPVPYAKGFDEFMDGNFPESNHYGQQSTNFIKGGGSNYEDAERASSGEKGTKGYLNRDEFSKGLKGRHQNDQRKGFYDVLGGDKLSHNQQEGHYASEHHSGHANKGGSFSEENSHDKGSKTTGYHKVYHKDEYKKDKSFYDKKDKKGYFNRYGDANSKEESSSGAVVNGKSVDDSFRQGKFGVQGVREQGKSLEESSGYNGADGEVKFYKNGASYANKAGKSQNKEIGFSDNKGEYYQKKIGDSPIL